jgi:hypothetical protein
MSKPLYFWIKERHNPQLGTYYVSLGQLTKAAAKKYEKESYGRNIMLPFKTAALRDKFLAAKKEEGFATQG